MKFSILPSVDGERLSTLCSSTTLPCITLWSGSTFWCLLVCGWEFCSQSRISTSQPDSGSCVSNIVLVMVVLSAVTALWLAGTPCKPRWSCRSWPVRKLSALLDTKLPEREEYLWQLSHWHESPSASKLNRTQDDGVTCYDRGPGMSRPSTYRLWLRYQVCHSVLVMDSYIGQQRYHMYDSMTHF